MLLFFLVASTSQAEPSAVIKKTDGTIFRYKFLTVRINRGHRHDVHKRLLFSLKKELPAQHEIDHAALPPVRDQGYRGTCAYFATVGLLETFYMKHKRFRDLRLSEECLVGLRNWEYETDSYQKYDKPDRRPDPNGDMPVLITNTVMRYGVPPAKKFSSLDCTYHGGENETEGQSIPLAEYQKVMIKKMHGPKTAAFGKGLMFQHETAPTIEKLKELLAKNIPVEVGVIVYHEYLMEGNHHWQFTPFLDADWNMAGGHAIILTGYHPDEAGKMVFTFKNSWGTNWGEEGYGTMDEEVLTNSWGIAPQFDAYDSLY